MPSFQHIAALRAWQFPSFRRFFWGSGLSVAGQSLQITVIGFIVYELTGSDFLLGLVAFTQRIPGFLLAPIVGVLVDNFERRRILAITFAAQATGFLSLAILSALELLSVPIIAAIVLLMGVANAFSFPARSALLPNLVGKDAIQSAIASNSVVSIVARVASPALGGLLIDVASVTAVLLIGSGLYYPAAAIMLSVPLVGVTAAAVARRPFSPGQAMGTFLGDLREVLGYIRGNPMLRASLFNDVVPFIFGMSYIAILPAIALQTLDGDGTTLGLLHGMVGAGSLIGTVTIGLMTDRGRRGMVIWIAMLGWGVALLTVAAGETYSTILPGLFLTGCFQTIFIVQNDTLVQIFTTDQYRGRVIAAQAMINSLTTFGFLELGAVAEATTISTALAIHGCALLGIGLVTILFRPAMRDLR